MDIKAVQPHKLRRKDRPTHVHVGKGDHTVLKVYAKTLKMTLTSALHTLLGIGACCYEEKHDQEIKELQERNRFQARIVVMYIRRYGTHAIKRQ